MGDLPDPSRHTPYSDPRRFAPLLRALGPDVEQIASAARNVIAHYRAQLPDLPPQRRPEIDGRWLDRTLAVDQERHGLPLDAPRPLTERVAGCCRDHSLFTVGALREHGIAARNRIGFAGYLVDGYHVDHVVVEHADRAGRWVMTDPELAAGDRPFDVRAMAHGIGEPFETAAEVWLAHRAGDLDVSTYGVFPGSELSGASFVASYVVFEVAHRFGDELLLWDDWSRPDRPVLPDELDGLARLLARADAGDHDAEVALFEQYRSDDRLHPGPSVLRHSPYGSPSVRDRLER
jgi:transglutaminase superfamily protein